MSQAWSGTLLLHNTEICQRYFEGFYFLLRVTNVQGFVVGGVEQGIGTCGGMSQCN